MSAQVARARTAALGQFFAAAARYWLVVFPMICREREYWRRSAEQIPDARLRGLALEAQRSKRGNLEGAAAFAVFAPRAQRSAVVRAQVAFQSAYDYADTLCEQPSDDPIQNGQRLHQALLRALDHEEASQPDYYAHFSQHDDAGYLEAIVNGCRAALRRLPASASITTPASRLAERIVAYQSLNLNEPNGGHRSLERWARDATPAGTKLSWWETAASAGSSLGVFALIAAAAHPGLLPREAVAIEDAYWPWIGALHSLLDSLVDESEDEAAKQRSLLAYYCTSEEAAVRLTELAVKAVRAAESLRGCEHSLILAGMSSYYLTATDGNSRTALLVCRGTRDTMGVFARLSTGVFRARRLVHRVSRSRAARTLCQTP
jgi:tetraprenyl-beta-curcumene synthase